MIKSVNVLTITLQITETILYLFENTCNKYVNSLRVDSKKNDFNYIFKAFYSQF